MKIIVRIHRQTPHEPRPGSLSAWVEQDGRHGRNLLVRRQMTNIDAARVTIKRELQKAHPGAVITFIGEEL